MEPAGSIARLQRRLLVVRTFAYALALPLSLSFGDQRDDAIPLLVMSLVAWFVPWLVERRPAGGALFVAMTLDAVMAIVGGATLDQPVMFEFGPILAVATAALMLTRAQAIVVLVAALMVRTLAIFGLLGPVPVPGGGMFGDRLTAVFLGIALWSFITVVLRQFRLTLTKESQRAIEAEARWRGYVQQTDQAIYVHSNGRIVEANPAMTALAGRAVERLPVDEVVVELPSDESDGPTEGLLFATDGTREVEMVTVPTTLHGATAELTVVTDLSARRLAERETLRLHEEINSLFGRLPVALYRATPDGRILAANQAMAELLGYASADELTELQSHRAFYARPSQRDEFQLAMAQSGFVQGFEQEVRRRDGTSIWVENTARAFHDDLGEVRFHEGALVDITARMTTADSHERLLSIIEQASDVVVVIGASGHILYANRAARSFYGVTSDGETVDYLPIAPAWLNEARNALSADIPFAAEQTLHTPSGHTREVHAVIEGHRDRWGQLSHISIIARDITELREAQARLEQLVANKDEFIAAVSHELRTPLSVVVGLSQELLSDQEISSEERLELMGMIAEQSSEVANLIEDLLVAARADTGAIRVHAESLQLRESVDSVIRSIVPHRDVAVDGDGDVFADAHRVRQIIRNLVTNAEKYGGDQIRVSIANGGPTTTLVVADNGEGIPVGARQRVFDPYERAHHETTRPGSVGLGLSVSRQLARLMEGDLTYTYRDGWSRFELELPALAE